MFSQRFSSTSVLSPGKETEVESCENAGNKLFNVIYEAKLGENRNNPAEDATTYKPLEGAHSATKGRYIREKYGDLLFYDKSKHYKHIENENTPKTPKPKSLRKFLHRGTSGKDKESLEINSVCSATVTSTLDSANSDSQSLFMVPTSGRGHAPIHPSGASSVCPSLKGRNQRLGTGDRKMALPQRLKSFDLESSDGGLGNNSFELDAPVNDFGDFNTSQSPLPLPAGQTKRSGSRSLSKQRSMLTKVAKDHTDPRREAFHQSKGALDCDFENDSDDDNESAKPASQKLPSNNGSQRGMRTNLGGSSSSGLDYRPKLMAAKAPPASRRGRVGMYSASARGRSSSRARDSSSVEPENRVSRTRSLSTTRNDSAIDDRVVSKGKESARERNASRSNAAREEVTSGRTRSVSRSRDGTRSVSRTRDGTRSASRTRDGTRSVSRTRDGTRSASRTRVSTRPSSRRGRSVKAVELPGVLDDLKGDSESVRSEASGDTESSTSRSSRSSRRLEAESPVAEIEPAKRAASTRRSRSKNPRERSRSKNPRERRERSVSLTRTAGSLEAIAKLRSESRGRLQIELCRPDPDLSEERNSSRAAKILLNSPLGLEGSTKPSRKLSTKSLQEVLVGSALTEGESDVSVGVRSLESFQKPKLRATLSGPNGGLGRPLRTQEEVMKDRRRRAICGRPGEKRGEGVRKREGRKSDIFASLDREKETVEMTAGPLMRQLPSRAKSDASDKRVRPHILRQGPTRSENTGPVFPGSGNTVRRGSTNSKGGVGHSSTNSQTTVKHSSHSQQSFGGRMGSMHGTGHSKSSLGSMSSIDGSDHSFGGEDFKVALGESHSSFANTEAAKLKKALQRKERNGKTQLNVLNGTGCFDNSFANCAKG
jgi:hypothetical protein